MSRDIKDLSSTAFGYVIGYLLPGLFALYVVSIWYMPIKVAFNAFVMASSTTGIFFLVILGALIVGLELMAFRWVLFDCIFLRRLKLNDDEFKSLTSSEHAIAFQIVVNEHYRYHQFWGGLTICIPFFFFGIAYSMQAPRGGLTLFGIVCVALLVEVVTACAAIHAYTRYILRARSILSGEQTNG